MRANWGAQNPKYYFIRINIWRRYDPRLYENINILQVTCKGIFSQEANREAKKILESKAHILNIYGENMRKTTNEGIQTLYMLTKFEN